MTDLHMADAWETDENIARMHMTKPERDRVLAAKARRVLAAAEAEAVAVKNQRGQNGQPEKPAGYKTPPPQTKGGTAEAARKLGVPRSTLRRALKAEAAAPDAPRCWQ